MSSILLDHLRYCPPLASQFTLIGGTNSENPTVTDTTGRGMVIDFGVSPATGDNVRTVMKAKTILTTTYSIIARMRSCRMLFHFNLSGICVSDGTKIVAFSPAQTASDTLGLQVLRYNSSTSFDSVRYDNNPMPKDYEWLRIDVVAGDPSKFYISDNGTDWINVFNESQTAFLTYSRVGFVLDVNRTSGPLPISGTNQLTAGVYYFSDPDIVPPV